MKKLLAIVALLAMTTMTTNAMSYEQARQQALFLTDKMAYELNLTEEQYEAAFEVNLDYLMSVNTIDDLYSVYWTRRNLDFSYILFDWQYRMFCDAIYFYRPLYWDAGYWHFRIYTRYPHRNYFYFGRPHFWTVYRGGHSWHKNGGRSWYHGRNFSGPKAGKRPDGMRDRFDRGDFKKPNVNDGRKGKGDFNKPNVNDGRKGRGDRPSSTRTTATRQATTTNAGQHVQSATDRQNDRTPNNTFTPNSRTTKTQSTTSSSTRTTRPTMSTTPATRRESTGTNVGSSISRSTRATSNSGSTTSRSTITPSRSTSSISRSSSSTNRSSSSVSRSSSSTNRSSAYSSRSNGGSSRGRR